MIELSSGARQNLSIVLSIPREGSVSNLASFSQFPESSPHPLERMTYSQYANCRAGRWYINRLLHPVTSATLSQMCRPTSCPDFPMRQPLRVGHHRSPEYPMSSTLVASGRRTRTSRPAPWRGRSVPMAALQSEVQLPMAFRVWQVRARKRTTIRRRPRTASPSRGCGSCRK